MQRAAAKRYNITYKQDPFKHIVKNVFAYQQNSLVDTCRHFLGDNFSEAIVNFVVKENQYILDEQKLADRMFIICGMQVSAKNISQLSTYLLRVSSLAKIDKNGVESLTKREIELASGFPLVKEFFDRQKSLSANAVLTDDKQHAVENKPMIRKNS